MALTVDSFVARFPEFSRTDPDHIQQKLDMVQAELSADSWGVHYDAAVGLRVAHALALAPLGERARREGPGPGNKQFRLETSTIYLDEYFRLRRRVLVPLTASGGTSA